MPLSEHELRTLEQLEAQLAADDPKFVHAMNHDPARRRRRQRALMVGLVALAGLGLIIVAAVVKQTWLGLVGALVLTAGALLSLQTVVPPRPLDPQAERTNRAAPPEQSPVHASGAMRGASVVSLPRATRSVGANRAAGRGTSPFMARLEERWERRRRETQGW